MNAPYFCVGARKDRESYTERRRFIPRSNLGLLFAVVCAVVLAPACQDEPDRQKKDAGGGSCWPNIVFILTDDQDAASL